MAKIDVSRQRDSLLGDAAAIQLLPRELLLLIQDGSSTQLLEAVANAALVSPATDRIFAHFEWPAMAVPSVPFRCWASSTPPAGGTATPRLLAGNGGAYNGQITGISAEATSITMMLSGIPTRAKSENL